MFTGLVACDGGGSADDADRVPTTVGASPEDEAAAAKVVVEAVTPGQMQGFDPAVWDSVRNKASVLPPGASLRVVDQSFVGGGESATIDAVLSRPGEPDEKVWVFLRKMNGRWVIYRTLPLGGREP